MSFEEFEQVESTIRHQICTCGRIECISITPEASDEDTETLKEQSTGFENYVGSFNSNTEQLVSTATSEELVSEQSAYVQFSLHRSSTTLKKNPRTAHTQYHTPPRFNNVTLGLPSPPSAVFVCSCAGKPWNGRGLRADF